MNTQGFINQVVKTYLNDIALRLSNQPEQQRAELLKQLESHIYEALDARCAGREATLGNLDGVLKEMDSPESYGEVVVPYATPAAVSPVDETRREVLFGQIAFALCLLGWLIIILVITRAMNLESKVAYVGVALEIIAIMLGVISWKTPLGKMAIAGGAAVILVL